MRSTYDHEVNNMNKTLVALVVYLLFLPPCQHLLESFQNRRFLEPDRSVSPRPNWNAEPEHMEVPRIIEWPGATWLDPLAQAMGALDRPRGPAWLDERTGRDPWDILTMVACLQTWGVDGVALI